MQSFGSAEKLRFNQVKGSSVSSMNKMDMSLKGMTSSFLVKLHEANLFLICTTQAFGLQV
jgi:hypothetical protein